MDVIQQYLIKIMLKLTLRALIWRLEMKSLGDGKKKALIGM